MTIKDKVTRAVSQAFQRAGLSLSRSSTMPKANLESFFRVLTAKSFQATHILDIGANRASWSGEASKFYPRARYTLVEPQEELAEFIEPFCAKHPGSEWIRGGVGGRQEMRNFVVDPSTVSSSFYIAEADRAAGQQTRAVKVFTLDSIVQRRGIPELIKIDAEGAEMEILQGGTSVFGKSELILLELPFFQFHPAVPTFSTMVTYMAKQGYEPFHFTWFHPRPHDGAQGLCELAFALRSGKLRAHQGYL
jgi:FkbM family methyltransferase